MTLTSHVLPASWSDLFRLSRYWLDTEMESTSGVFSWLYALQLIKPWLIC